MKAKDLLKKAVAYSDMMVAQIIPYQVMDEHSENYGGYFNQGQGFCSVTHYETAGFVRYMGYSYCSEYSRYYNDSEILNRIIIAINFIESKQHESGFIDLRDRNYDSPPDTAFALGCLYPIAWMAKNIPNIQQGDKLYAAIRPFVVKAANSIADHGGFHTPNHRWIIMGALAGSANVFPEVNASESIDLYLKETIDLNLDGIYSEKSIFYSSHINQKLMDAYYYMNDEYIADCIVKNCRCIVDLMNNDTSILTSISIRQDNGQHVFPTDFIGCFYFAAKFSDDERLFSAVEKICNKNPVQDISLIYMFARNRDWLNDDIFVPEFVQKETRFLEDTGIWAYNRGELDVFVLSGVSNQMCIRYGDIFISSIRINAPYFSCGQHCGYKMIPTENGIKMITHTVYTDEQSIHMPGYWKPLGRPVTFDELPYNDLADRIPTPRPEVKYIFDIEKREDGIDLTVSSDGGVEGAHFALQFDFDIPGAVITDNTFENISAPGSKILTNGYLTYRKGVYAATIGPGFFEHSMISTPKKSFSVNMTADLPFKKTVQITFRKLNNHDVPEYYLSNTTLK